MTEGHSQLTVPERVPPHEISMDDKIMLLIQRVPRQTSRTMVSMPQGKFEAYAGGPYNYKSRLRCDK